MVYHFFYPTEHLSNKIRGLCDKFIIGLAFLLVVGFIRIYLPIGKSNFWWIAFTKNSAVYKSQLYHSLNTFWLHCLCYLLFCSKIACWWIHSRHRYNIRKIIRWTWFTWFTLDQLRRWTETVYVTNHGQNQVMLTRHLGSLCTSIWSDHEIEAIKRLISFLVLCRLAYF